MELPVFEARRSFLLWALQLIAPSFLARTSASPKGSAKVYLNLPLSNPAIIVIKKNRVLELYSEGRLIKRYRVGLGLSPLEDKVRAGDRRTPEGEYYICAKNPRSQFYLSLQLSYPNQRHSARGLRDGLITRSQYNQMIHALDRRRVPPQNTKLGGEFFIHGSGSQNDWTWGCVALDDVDMRELYDAIPVGTPVTIRH